MNQKTYRICLVMLILAAMVSGICYYRLVCQKEVRPKDGIFVYWDAENGCECV